jgi:DinB family protein
MPRKEIKDLLSLLDQAYAGPAWHGPCLRVALRGVTHRAAARRPGPGRNSIWELVVHLAFWKYAVRRRLLGEKRGNFPEKGRNFFPRPIELKARAWQRDLALLARMHKELRATAASLDDSALDRRSRGSRQTPRYMIAGIAMHDTYHGGQIQLLKRLFQQSRVK